MDVGSLGSKHLLLLGEVGTVCCDNALRVEHYDILYLCSQCYIKLCAADGSCSGTIHNDAHIGNILACHLKSVLQSGS